ncbi:MAG: efflux RND transporter permease subunit [Bdellovibrionota bacterium]
MKITDLFISRPVLSICVNLILLLAGIKAVQTLTTRQYPVSDLAVVKITTAYVGANAELVRGFVTTPLERVIASADGIDYLESSSKQGVSEISAHLRLNFDINAALTQVQAKVAQVRNDLPPEAEAPVIDVETSDNRIASVYLSFYSDVLEPNQITDYLTRVVQPKLSAVKGVQKADILGARTFAMRVWLKPDRMAAMNISPSQVKDALNVNNYLSAIGKTKGSMVSVNLTANTDLQNREEFENLVVKSDGDSLVRLKDIADIVLGAEDYDQDVRFDGKQATFMGVWVLPNANSLDVIKDVRAALPAIEKNLPSGLKLSIPYDATKYIESAIEEVLKTLTETILIVILVIFLFLGSFRSVLVPVVAIPLSLIGAALLMFLFGFTLNLLTLLAIVLAVGLVVDDAIVMLENVERYVQQGKAPIEAALIAARELVGPIIAMTITLVAVYAPIGIQGGLTGVLFKEFAFTLAGAVFISGFVALTLSPMMSAYLVKKDDNPSALKVRVDSLFNKLKNLYATGLKRTLKFRFAVIVASALLILFLPLLYMFSAKELAPREDQGILFGIVQASPDSTLDQTTLYTEQVTKVFESFPEYDKSFQLTFPTNGFSGMLTKPWSERSRTTLEMEPEAWIKASKIPGVRVIMTSPPPLPGGSDFPIEMVISTTENPERLYELSKEFVNAAFASGLYMYADSDLKYDLSQTKINIDRNKIAAMGLNLKSVGNDLSIMTGGNYVNRFNIQGRSYKVIPQIKRNQRLNPEQLKDIYVQAGNQELVALGTIATLENSVQPRELKRFQQLNSVKIQGAIPPGVSIDQALNVLETKAAEILPAGFEIDYAGESRQLRKEGSTFITTLLLAIVFIYLVLASQFESFRDPFIILAGSVPLALFGSLIFSFLGLTSMNIYSQVGLVTLVGLVSKNGILIVEFANLLQEQGLTKIDAIQKACQTRLRPILMTSVATIVGHFPLILASGAGAEARNSIGIILVSGMFIGSFFTLFVVPVIYSFVSKEKNTENKSMTAENNLITRKNLVLSDV